MSASRSRIEFDLEIEEEEENQKEERIRQEDVTGSNRSNCHGEEEEWRFQERLGPIQVDDEGAFDQEEVVISWLNHWNVLTAVRSSRTRRSIWNTSEKNILQETRLGVDNQEKTPSHALCLDDSRFQRFILLDPMKRSHHLQSTLQHNRCRVELVW